MDLNKFTERSKEILNSAQVLAMMQNHQLLQPVHLLSGIIEDDDTASLLFAPAGLDLKGTNNNDAVSSSSMMPLNKCTGCNS